jgi:lipopolysaccharide transport system permease protein
VWDHRAVLWILARKDFQVRYKRATLGVLWAVAVPILQGVVLTVVFSRFVPVEGEVSYAAYVLSGVVAWGYFSPTIASAVTAIVDGADLTDKIWFPRALLPLVACVSSLVGLGVSIAVLVVATPLVGGSLEPRVLLLVPATLLLFGLTAALSLVLAALQVYFRDVRFMVAAALLVGLYCTPILYQRAAVGGLGPWLDLNPLTGVVGLFHLAIVGGGEPLGRAVAVSVVTFLVLSVVALEVHRRHDRLFVDLL